MLTVLQMFSRATLRAGQQVSGRAVVAQRPVSTKGANAASSPQTKTTRGPPPLTTKEVIAREDRYGAHNYKPLPVAISRAKGECVKVLKG